MGSTFQTLLFTHALSQRGMRYEWLDPGCLQALHQGQIRRLFRRCDESPRALFVGKAHAAFPSQVEALMSARACRIFLVWRPHRDCLVSDFHYARRGGGHRYAGFDDYFARRGRRVLLRNRLQEVVWKTIDDPRVRSWEYLDLVQRFAATAGDMLGFGAIEGVDLAALRRSLSMDELRRRYRDPSGKFFRAGGSHELSVLHPGARTLDEIGAIELEQDWRRLGRACEAESRIRTLVFGPESKEAGLRKSFHAWLIRSGHLTCLQHGLVKRVHRLFPRRLPDAIRSRLARSRD